MLLICASACANPSAPSPDDQASSEKPPQINPARIDRARGFLPEGYEVSDLVGPISPIIAWGYGARWSTHPARCAALADPTADATSTDGWTASGPGGIVYAVVASGPGDADHAALDECREWTVESGRTTGSVTLGSAPAIEDASTVAMATSSTTVVEGGTETRAHADTVTAYLGDGVAFVAVVTDPGSPNPQLDSAFAAHLMTETVSALRG